MSRSRAFNRSTRFTAKKRRRALREVLPGFHEETPKAPQSPDHSNELRQKAIQKEAVAELLEPNEIELD